MKNKVNKEAKFKVSYLREIDRNAMLFATQPKPRTYKSIYETPVEVLGRVVVVLSKSLERAIENYETIQKVEKEVKKKSKGKAKQESEMIRLTAMVESASSTWSNRNKALLKAAKKGG